MIKSVCSRFPVIISMLYFKSFLSKTFGKATSTAEEIYYSKFCIFHVLKIHSNNVLKIRNMNYLSTFLLTKKSILGVTF